jgi:hypothetical protein
MLCRIACTSIGRMTLRLNSSSHIQRNTINVSRRVGSDGRNSCINDKRICSSASILQSLFLSLEKEVITVTNLRLSGHMTLPTWHDLICDAKSRGNIKEQVPDNELGVAERRRKVAVLLLDLNDLDPIVVVEQITVPSQAEAHVLGVGEPEPIELCVAAFQPTRIAQTAIQLQLHALDLPSGHIQTDQFNEF